MRTSRLLTVVVCMLSFHFLKANENTSISKSVPAYFTKDTVPGNDETCYNNTQLWGLREQDSIAKIYLKLKTLLTWIKERVTGVQIEDKTYYNIKLLPCDKKIYANQRFFKKDLDIGFMFSQELGNRIENNLQFKRNRLVANDSTWRMIGSVAEAMGEFNYEQWETGLSHIGIPPRRGAEFCGYMIYLLGGTQKQAELYYSDWPEHMGLSMPGREECLRLVHKGYAKAKSMYKLKN